LIKKKGVLNYYEFINFIEPLINNNNEYFEYLKQITYSKLMNRRHTSLINKPLSELDLTSIIKFYKIITIKITN
jgi:hypothetical protein